MKRITDISQLSKGDTIVNVNANGGYVFYEYISPHPHNDCYGVFLDSTKQVVPIFSLDRLKNEGWYLYKDSGDWQFIRKLQIDALERKIKLLKARR